LHNGDWKNAVSPHFLHKRTSEARGYQLTVVRYQIQAALAQFAEWSEWDERHGR